MPSRSNRAAGARAAVRAPITDEPVEVDVIFLDADGTRLDATTVAFHPAG